MRQSKLLPIQRYGDHTLIEPTVVFVLAGLIIPGVGDVAHPGIGEAVGGQEGAAAHAGIHVALELLHLLLGDVVRHHAPGGTFGRQLRQVPIGGVLVDVVFLQHIDQLGEGGYGFRVSAKILTQPMKL